MCCVKMWLDLLSFSGNKNQIQHCSWKWNDWDVAVLIKINSTVKRAMAERMGSEDSGFPEPLPSSRINHPITVLRSSRGKAAFARMRPDPLANRATRGAEVGCPELMDGISLHYLSRWHRAQGIQGDGEEGNVGRRRKRGWWMDGQVHACEVLLELFFCITKTSGKRFLSAYTLVPEFTTSSRKVTLSLNQASAIFPSSSFFSIFLINRKRIRLC